MQSSATVSSRTREKDPLAKHRGIVFSRGQTELSPARNQNLWEWNCSSPSILHCWWSFGSAISHLLSLLPSVTLLACSLDASPCVQLLYYTTVIFKVLYYKIKNVFFIFVFVLHVLCEKYYKPITVVQCYLADHVTWVPRLTMLDLWPNST